MRPTGEEGVDPRSALPPEVRMGGDIARAMAHLGDAAPQAIATHLRKFWDPRMRTAIVAQWERGEIEDELLAAAVEAYREGDVDRQEVGRPAGEA